MKLSTMAAVMSYVSKIENASALFYENHAEKYPELKDTFLSWAKENKKFEKNIKRTYFGVITDTLESNFAFEGLDTDDYEIEALLSENANISEETNKAHEIEETIKGFYLKAAQLSEGLMADIPRLFKKIAMKREERSQSLEAF
ncbi:MAG: hypothetical protein JSV50_20605 [Desulfobacteraceae bacterium]|jgi:hypothetical protein|nr:MAG: hypothetical protein JSV50_20605 [Desulfobacteraceae bacterium]